jgi:hypothetical protein
MVLKYNSLVVGVFYENERVFLPDRLRIRGGWKLFLASLRSRRLVRAGELRASFEETPAQMAMTN